MRSMPTTHKIERIHALRVLVAAVVIASVSLPGVRVAAAGDPGLPPDVSVRQERGTYRVMARFEVPQPPTVVLAVLSDYEEIPRYMPDVKTSTVLERAPGRLVVEQRVVSKFMFFSKDVHLVLEVTEAGDSLTFTDRCRKSFKSYDGSWRVEPKGNGSIVIYELAAEPAFDVPEFILKRLLKRDSGQLINRLRVEFAKRSSNERP